MKDYKEYTAVDLIFENFSLRSDKDFKTWMLHTYDYLKKMELQQMNPNLDSVDRFEVIDHTSNLKGRCYTAHGCQVEMSLQDDSKTLKIFVTDKK